MNCYSDSPCMSELKDYLQQHCAANRGIPNFSNQYPGPRLERTSEHPHLLPTCSRPGRGTCPDLMLKILMLVLKLKPFCFKHVILEHLNHNSAWKRNSNYSTFYESQGFPTVKPLLSEKEKPQTLCCPPSLLSVLSIRWFLSRMNCSTPPLPLPHLDQPMRLSGLFAGQASCACSGSQPWAQPGLLPAQVHIDWHFWQCLWKISERVDSNLHPCTSASIAPPQDHTPTQAKQDVPGN